MIFDKNIILSFIIGVIIGALGMYLLKKPEIKEVKVPIKIEVPVPIINKEYDTIYLPSPIKKEIDSNYYNKYKSIQKDSIKLDSLIKNLIEIKEYHELIEDDTIKINLYTKTRGDLLKYQIGYETKPYNIPLDTTIYVKIPQKPEFYIGASINTNIKPLFNNSNFYINGAYINKKHNKLFLGGYDIINKQINTGILIKF